SKRPFPIGFVTIFMAGAPGVGKTEFSNRYIPLVYDKKIFHHISKRLNIDMNTIDNIIVRLDADDVRSLLPQYRKTDNDAGTKGNSHVVQKASGKGLDFLRDYCLSNNISFINDGTFVNYYTMES